jgi:hypothetical protein
MSPLGSLAVVWVFGDKGEPASTGFGDAAAFLAAEHPRTVALTQRPKGPICDRN